MDNRVVTAHVPVPLAEKVDELAARIDRSRGWIVKQALTEWVAQEEERYRLTKLALLDVDEGRVVGHDRVREWIDSLVTGAVLPVPRP